MIVAFINVFLNWFFGALIVLPLSSLLKTYITIVYPLKLSFEGAQIATALSFNIVSLASILYAYFFVPRTAWAPIGRGVWVGWGVLSRLSMAGIGASESSIFYIYWLCKRGLISFLHNIGQTASAWWTWDLVGREWLIYPVHDEANSVRSGC